MILIITLNALISVLTFTRTFTVIMLECIPNSKRSIPSTPHQMQLDRQLLVSIIISNGILTINLNWPLLAKCVPITLSRIIWQR